MRIALDEQYQISTDPFNFILQKRRPALGSDDQIKWDVVTYHHNLAGAVESYIDKSIKMSDVTSLAELSREIESIKERVRQVLLPLTDSDWEL